MIIRLDLSGLPPVAEWDAADPPGEWEGLGCASRPVDQVEIWNPARGLPAEFVCAEE